MKKLIAVLAMVALISGAAFAQIGANVIGTINFAENGVNDEGDDVVTGSGGMNRIRFQGTGSNDEGTFGGFIRLDGAHWSSTGFEDWHPAKTVAVEGLAWWKPMDMLKLSIGGNSDGIWGKEGVAGWSFYQMVSDTGVVNAASVWDAAGSYYNGFPVWNEEDQEFENGGLMQYREAFFGGFGGQGLLFDITPADMFAINIALPFIDAGGAEVADIFKALTLQIDVNMDFGNIALTYVGDADDATNGDIFLYAGLGLMDNFSLDIGFAMTLAGDAEGFPFRIGLGGKFDVTDEFGLKFRTAVSLAGDDKVTRILFDVLPYYAISESMKFFCSIGLGMMMPDEGDSLTGFHVNPYLEIGNEWGPTFYVGAKIWNTGEKDSDIQWAIPLAIGVSF